MKDSNPRQQDSEAEVHLEHPEISAELVENSNELGTVQIHNGVIAAITRVAALKVPGVVEFSGGLVDGLAGMIGKKSGDRGIRVEFDDAAVAIEVNVVLAFGVRIPHVAWQIQTEVRKAVEQMTGKPVKAVNVIVQSVRISSGTPPTEAEELAP
ncbi:MAG: Asp23/Gls24 family envelope stress response protein [Kiritimatiellae bacterium]|nr:Asp23/Gls24 family envelope stress response protein [Kiritimatiellia bacterium]MCO5060886.1 Asp23/Gls24 family envelope stress response protein [Kiritimatiellia bacterium]MCO5069423.1 Asp23/Gls24 family envelope stress response protein [Kiritimatiellia bacterium]MCO6401746.1 Asp23/Gls24 family envelope stress response protein [Verrucomicrobiota bacterium]